MQTIENLRRSVHAWLVDHELNADTRFYTREEWRARDEEYLADAALVLVFEGELFRVMNSHHEESIKLQADLEQFVRSLGYFLELGHAWSMGFYPLPEDHGPDDLRIAAAAIASTTSRSNAKLHGYQPVSSRRVCIWLASPARPKLITTIAGLPSSEIACESTQ